MHRSVLLLCVLFASGAVAETLEEAWDAALAANRQLAAAAAERDAAGLELDRARAARRPQLGLATSYQRLDAAPAFAFGDGLQTGPLFDGDDFVRAGASVRVPIYSGGAIASGIAAAAFGADAAGQQLESLRQDIRLAVAELYVGVLRAESAVEVAASIVASLDTHTENTRNRFELGAVPRNEFLAASVSLANAEQRLLAAENDLDYARAAYNRFLGRPLEAPVALDPAPAPGGLVPASLELEALIREARAGRPQLETLAAEARALRAQSRTARAASRPQLALTGGYVLLENEVLDDDAFWTAGVSVSWQLFDGGASRKHAAALDNRADALGHRRADLESLVALEVRRAWFDRIEAESRFDVAARSVEQADENLRVVRNRYAAGASTSVEVLDAEALRERALANRDDARFEVILSGLRLARATGRL